MHTQTAKAGAVIVHIVCPHRLIRSGPHISTPDQTRFSAADRHALKGGRRRALGLDLGKCVVQLRLEAAQHAWRLRVAHEHGADGRTHGRKAGCRHQPRQDEGPEELAGGADGHERAPGAGERSEEDAVCGGGAQSVVGCAQ